MRAVGRGLAEHLGHLPSVFALYLRKQSAQVAESPIAGSERVNRGAMHQCISVSFWLKARAASIIGTNGQECRRCEPPSVWHSPAEVKRNYSTSPRTREESGSTVRRLFISLTHLVSIYSTHLLINVGVGN
jgi:hypothetical protein